MVSKFIELIKRFHEIEGDLESNREKLYIKEAILLEAVPKKYKEEYCIDRGYIITSDPEMLIDWMREVDKRKKSKYRVVKVLTYENLDFILNTLKLSVKEEKLKYGKSYSITLLFEEL